VTRIDGDLFAVGVVSGGDLSAGLEVGTAPVGEVDP
jgi:hypothetical protein